MRAGVIRSRDHLQWRASDARWEDPGVRLSETFQDVRAFYCPGCRQVIVPVPEVEGVWKQMQKKLGEVSEKLSGMKEQFDERRTRADQAKKEKEHEKKGKNDPWEL